MWSALICTIHLNNIIYAKSKLFYKSLVEFLFVVKLLCLVFKQKVDFYYTLRPLYISFRDKKKDKKKTTKKFDKWGGCEKSSKKKVNYD